MRVATLALVWPPTLINSHALSSTFELVQILMRVNESFGSFDRSWELHESRRELQKQAISKSLPIRRRRKKENIITYHRRVTVGVMTRTVSSLTSVKKRRKRSGEATSKNKEIEKRRKTLVNSHATLTARLTEQWELRKHSCKLSPANSHRLSSSFDPGFSDVSGKQPLHGVRGILPLPKLNELLRRCSWVGCWCSYLRLCCLNGQLNVTDDVYFSLQRIKNSTDFCTSLCFNKLGLFIC